MQVKVVGVVSTVRLARGETAVVERTPILDSLVAAGFVRIEPADLPPSAGAELETAQDPVPDPDEVPAAEVVEPVKKTGRRRG